MRIYILCPSLLQSFTKFCWVISEELRWQTVLSNIFHIGQISRLKKGVTLSKKIPVDMHIYTLCPSILKSFMKSVERFQRSCADKKKRTDGLTDGRVKNIIPFVTRCMGYNNAFSLYGLYGHILAQEPMSWGSWNLQFYKTLPWSLLHVL